MPGSLVILNLRHSTAVQVQPFWLKKPMQALLLALVYFGVSKLSLLLAIPPGYATAVWPAAGLGAAAVLIWGWHLLPGIWLGSCLTNLSVALSSAQWSFPELLASMPLPAVIALGATAHVAIAVFLIKRFVAYPNPFDDARSVLMLLGIAGPLGCLISAGCGSLALNAFGLISPDDWLFTAWTWWIGDTLGVLIFLPLSLLIFGQPRSAWLYRRWLVGGPLTLSFTVAVAILVSANQQQEEKLKSDFEQDVAFIATSLQLAANNASTVIHDTATQLAILETVNHGQFLDVAHSVLHKQLEIDALIWVPQVPAEQLNDFEAKIRSTDFPDFTIRNSNPETASGDQVARPSMPVLYQAPLQGSEVRLGTNLAAALSALPLGQSASWHSSATLNALELWPGSASSLVMVTPIHSRRPGKALLQQPSLDDVQGYLLAQISISGLLKSMLIHDTVQDLSIRLRDLDVATGASLLFSKNADQPSSRWQQSGEVSIGARRVGYEVEASRAFVSQHRSIFEWTILASALAFSGLLGAFLLVISGRMFRVEAAVNERTQSLQSEILERERAQDALRRSEARYKELAFHDSLTGLANREFLSRELVKAIYDAKNTGQHLAVHFFDLDHFKDINDSMGHPVGDELLIRIAEVMKSKLRTDDILARLGGDEFAILQTQLSHHEQASDLAKRITSSLSVPFEIQEYEVRTSTSVGISYLSETSDAGRTDEEIAVQLMEQADIALYAVKYQQRGGYAFHESSMSQRLHKSLAIGHELKRTIFADSGELALVFQPQQRFSDGGICGFEALLRFNSKKLGSVSPTEFIAIAEARGLISELGRYTLRQVCKLLAQTKGQLPCGQPYRIAVNISVTQFTDPGFAHDVIQIIQQSGVDPSHIELEVTEAALSRSIDQVQKCMTTLRAFGLSIAIDDFGTGYSSLLYLKRMPVQRLKVAQEFVRDMLHDQADAEIVKATVQIAKAMDLELIAEGIETAQHADHLKALGCDIAQGFYYSRPISQTQFLAQWGLSTKSAAA